MEPLVGAISAGNTAVLKPSELVPACSSLLANTMMTYLDNKAIKIIEGGPDVGQQLLQERWDKIFFTGIYMCICIDLRSCFCWCLNVEFYIETGNARVGRLVMAAAAKHLTPVVLELGGKCPAILDSLSWSWDREVKRALQYNLVFFLCNTRVVICDF